MASAVDICNLALSHLGDSATVTSIDPPEGSAQAGHCKRFYPISRDALLEMHSWGFATRRAVLALTAEEMDQWAYVYVRPNKALKILAVLANEAASDYVVPVEGVSVDQYGSPYGPAAAAHSTYAPQPFHEETLSDGTRVICTNQDEAMARYIVSVTDTTKFSPLFIEALGWLLASKLAGPLLKGKTARDETKRCYQFFLSALAEARASDAQSRDIRPTHVVPWMNGR